LAARLVSINAMARRIARCALLPALLSFAQGASLRNAPPDPDMATVEARLLASYVVASNVSGVDADIKSFLPLIVPPGQFSDLDYTVGQPTGWGGYDHCLRFAEMASALYTPASAYFDSAALRAALLDADKGVFAWFLSAQPHDDGAPIPHAPHSRQTQRTSNNLPPPPPAPKPTGGIRT
jgi:hypothetical protein